MSGKRLLPLVALLVLLVAAAIVLKRQPAPTRLSEEVGFERLVPQALRPDRISGLVLYQGAQPEDLVRLRRQDGTWVVASHYDAPVRADKITPFLDSLSTLEGELRSDHAELLGDFHLETAQALHLQIYTDDQETSAVHLLAGEGRGRNSFMRIADENRVYSVNLNLRREAGLYGDNTDQTPQAKPWLDLHIQNLPGEPVTALALHTPSRRWRFIHQQPTSPSPDAPQVGAATELQWTLAEPNLPYAVKQGALDGLVSTLRTLRAEDMADSANLAEYGLDEAPYRVTLTAQPEAEQAVRQATLWIGNEVPEQAGKRYARLGQEGPVYILPQWVSGRLFPQGKEILDLPGLQLPEPEIQQIALLTSTATVRLTRPSASATAGQHDPGTPAWTLAHPQIPFTVQQDNVEPLVHQLATFTPDEVVPADSVVPPPPSEALPRVEITLQDASRHRLQLGPALVGHPQQYALYLNDHATPFVIDDATRNHLFPPLRTLLDLHILRVQPREITRLTWQQDGASWSLERSASAPTATPEAQAVSAWRLVEAPRVTVQPQAVNTLLATITPLTADDWIESSTPQTHLDPPVLTLTLTLRDGHTERLALGKDEQGHYASVQGTPGLFVVPEAAYTALLEALTTLHPANASAASVTPETP